MVSLTGAWSHFVSSYHSFGSCPDFPLLVSVTHPRRQRHCYSLHLFVAKEGGSPGFSCFRKRSSWIGFVPRCKRWESEGDPDLEAEIMEFMEKSEKPDVFPSKKELIAAGRSDLVEGILEQGGWLSLGWDLDEEETVREAEFRDWNLVKEKESGDDDSRIFEQGLESRKGSDYSEEIEVWSSGTSCSSSSRSTEMEVRDDAGIEGILSRLEKERNLSLGFGLKESSSGVRSNDSPGSISGDTVGGLEKSSRSTSLRVIEDLANDSGAMLSKDGSTLDSDDCIKKPPKPEMWRTWSLQRAGFSDADFEAAEIAANESGIGGMTSAVDDKIFALHKVENVGTNYKKELNAGVKESDRNQIQSRLRRLELELAAVLYSVRSRTEEVIKKRVEGTSSEELQKLSDALEFQETEIMNAKDQLRSTQAKLAVLEGKMALAIIEAQKVVEEKQKRIDDDTKALSLLHATCIVWPNAASEVLLAGSFDGWVTQRKMERSSTGIFSVCLKLYPGRYEIKFIVDGIWKIDPLRPIVNNNGYENNLLIIS